MCFLLSHVDKVAGSCWTTKEINHLIFKVRVWEDSKAVIRRRFNDSWIISLACWATRPTWVWPRASGVAG
jgi:hypothetical protein